MISASFPRGIRSFRPDLFRTEEDYARLADHYLTSLARDGAIYSEVFTSPDHAERAGLSAQAYVSDALGEGMNRAKAKTGIEARMIVIGVRHVGVRARRNRRRALRRAASIRW
jgi:adenosine deaminase